MGAVKNTVSKRRVYAKEARHTSKRRKKVGAISPVVEIIIGAVAGSFVTRVIEANLPAPTTGQTDYRPYTGLVVGGAAEFFGKKNLLVRSMGIGAIVEGTRSIIDDKYIPKLLNQNKVSGINDNPLIGAKRMKRLMGIQTNPLIATNRDMSVLNGTANTTGIMGAALTDRGSSFGYDGVF